MNTRSRRKFDPNNLTVRDVVVIVPVVIVVSIIGIVFAMLVSHETYIKWGGLAVFTGMLFWFFVRDSQKYFRRKKFWLLTAVLLCAHVAIFVAVLTHVAEWGLAWFWLAIVVEAPLFFGLRQWLM